MLGPKKASVASTAATMLVDSIAGIDRNQSPEHDTVEEARRLCRNGNPFPLIALQWPEFVVKGDDCKYFEGAEDNKLDPCLRFDWWQRLIFRAMFDVAYPEIFVKGCTGPGKGACFAVAINLDFDCRDECMWNITADTNKHAHEVMFGEILKWRKKMLFPCEGRELGTTIVTNERKFITVLNPEKSSEGESFSGRHGAKYAFDEASSTPDVFYENACKNASKIIASSNPRTRTGFFRAGFRKLANENKTGITMGVLGKRLCVTVGGEDCSNVIHKRVKEPKSPVGGITINGVEYPEGDALPDEAFDLARPLIPGQMDINQFNSIIRNANEKWKVQCFAFGMFPDEDPTSQFIMSSWLKACHDHHTKNYLDLEVNAFGLDVAKSLDGDETVLSCGGYYGCKDLHKFKLKTYPEIAQRVMEIALSYGIDLLDGLNPICIDYGGGYGAGVGEWIEQSGAWVIPHNPGNSANVIPALFQNQRTEDWGMFAARIDPKGIFAEAPFALPEDPKMVEEMLAMTKIWDKSRIRYSAMSKELMKTAFADARSPDAGDSVVMLFRAVREREQLDGMLKSAIVSGELLTSHAGGKQDTEAFSGPKVSPSEFLDDILNFYKQRRTGRLK